MIQKKSSDDKRKPRSSQSRKRQRSSGNDSSMPAGRGDPEAPHPLPGSNRFGGSLSRDKKKP